MTSRKVRFFFLLLGACALAALISCPVPEPADTATRWNFDADEEGWSFVSFDSNPMSLNQESQLDWSATEGSPGMGCLKIVAPFSDDAQYFTVVAPIVADPITAGTYLSGKKLTVRVRAADYPAANAWIFSNTGPVGVWPSGLSSTVPLGAAAEWKTIEFDMTSTDPAYDPTDMRFLGVLISSGWLTASGSYTFYVDTCVLEEAP